jgi:hypothetical protein
MTTFSILVYIRFLCFHFCKFSKVRVLTIYHVYSNARVVSIIDTTRR